MSLDYFGVFKGRRMERNGLGQEGTQENVRAAAEDGDVLRFCIL